MFVFQGFFEFVIRISLYGFANFGIVFDCIQTKEVVYYLVGYKPKSQFSSGEEMRRSTKKGYFEHHKKTLEQKQQIIYFSSFCFLSHSSTQKNCRIASRVFCFLSGHNFFLLNSFVATV
jgi:hypothetical protein